VIFRDNILAVVLGNNTNNILINWFKKENIDWREWPAAPNRESIPKVREEILNWAIDKYEWLWMFDPDIIPSPCTIDALSVDDADIVAPRTWRTGKMVSEIHAHYLHCACLLLRLEAIKKLPAPRFAYGKNGVCECRNFWNIAVSSGMRIVRKGWTIHKEGVK